MHLIPQIYFFLWLKGKGLFQGFHQFSLLKLPWIFYVQVVSNIAGVHTRSAQSPRNDIPCIHHAIA